MLRYETVEPGTLALLRRLMGVEALKDFALVGRTALSLRYGHRLSVDLDLFTDGEMDARQVIAALTEAFGDAFTYRDDQQAKWAVFGFIDGIKVDFVRIPHARIADLQVVDGLRLYTDADIGPMKVEAILLRARKKDFWDIAEILRAVGFQQLMDDHRRKYPKSTIPISISRAITYFKDAEEDMDPVSLKGQTWDSVKTEISELVNGHLR
jgi:hypothetical protein